MNDRAAPEAKRPLPFQLRVAYAMKAACVVKAVYAVKVVFTEEANMEAVCVVGPARFDRRVHTWEAANLASVEALQVL